MLKNHKKFSYPLIFLVLLIVCFSLLSIEFCFARRIEVPLPGLPANPSFPNYIKFIFNLAMGIAGTIAVIYLIIGGFRLIIAAGNPAEIGEAKKTILMAIIGMVLLLSSFIILRTINPQLKKLKTPNLSLLPGLYFRSSKGLWKPAERVVSDFNKLKPYHIISWPEYIPGTNRINCRRSATNPIGYFIYFFKDNKFREMLQYTMVHCDQEVDITKIKNAKAFWIVKRTPGIIFYPYKDCFLKPTEGIPITHTSSIPEWSIDDKPIKSVRILNGTNELRGPFYNLISHDLTDYRQLFYHIHHPFLVDDRCINKGVPDPVTVNGGLISITIYKWTGYRKTAEGRVVIASAGNGITFYSRKNWTGGSVRIPDDDILNAAANSNEGTMTIRLDKLKYTYTGTNISKEEQQSCKYVSDCPGSLEIGGNYLVLLTTKKGTAQRFPISKRLAEKLNYNYNIGRGPINLKTDWITQHTEKIDYAVIIPLAEKL